MERVAPGLQGILIMAAGDVIAWRKQNSDPVTVDIVLTDGSSMRAVVLVPKGKTLESVFNVETAFIEVETLEYGATVFCISSVRLVRASALPKADQLERKAQVAEKLGAYALLKIAKTATRLEVVEARQMAKAAYEPEGSVMAALPEEVQAYMQAMSRRIEQAALEVLATLPEAATGTAKGAAQAA
jgi:hypothetical protein